MVAGKFSLAALALTGLVLVGCGQSTDSTGAASTSVTADGGPEAVISKFLAAVKGGDDKLAASLLTDLARQKTTEMEIVVAPPGSETASYKVLESEVQGSEAQVGTDWTDLDGDGRPRTDRVVWMLKQQPAGWRISGMATRVFPDMPPVILNFEDPEDMMRKQQEAEAEIARRMAQPDQNPQGEAITAENPASQAGEEATIR